MVGRRILQISESDLLMLWHRVALNLFKYLVFTRL